MKDLGRAEVGAFISHVTGQHTNYPASNVIKDSSGCWVSTGSFPQSLVVSLQKTSAIQEVTIEAYNVKYMELFSSVSDRPKDYQKVSDSVLEATDNTRQVHQVFLAGKDGKLSARHLRISVKSGHGPFIAVYNLRVLGEAGGGGKEPDQFDGAPAKEPPAFTLGSNSTGSKFGTAFSTQPIKADVTKFESFKMPQSVREPSPPLPTHARFDELESAPAQGTAVMWGEQVQLDRDEVMIFDRDEDN